MSEHAGRQVVKLLILGMLCFLALLGYVLWQSYEGRVDLVNASRAACERGKLDRMANASGWRIAQQRALSQGQPWFARQYNQIANGLEVRGRISCSVVFPDASFLP